MGNLINSQRNAASASVTTNTNTNTNMTKIKSYEIVVNLILTSGEINQGSLDKTQNTGNGLTLVKGRSISRITATKDRESIFCTFIPLPEVKRCAYNRNNLAVVIAHMEDGSSKILNEAQTKAFWARGQNLGEGVDICDQDFKVICDIPGYDADEANELLRNGEARSLRIRFADGMPQFSRIEDRTNRRYTLRPRNASVDFASTTIGADPKIITFNVGDDILEIEDNNVEEFDAAKFSKSAKRREGRKAQSEAARQSVERVVYFDGAPVETVAPEVAATPVVETPVVTEVPAPQVDMAAMIQQAVAAAIAPLTQEIASLRSELKAKDAEIEALKAAQAQPVAPTPVVVEEVTPEPVSEPEPEVVEEEPAVEETVEEAPKAPNRSFANFTAGANAQKARKAGNETDDVDADFYMVDFD